MKSLSRVWLFANPWTVAYQVPPSMGFSRQEYWSGLPFLSPGGLPHPGIKPRSPAFQADALTLSHQGSQCLSLPWWLSGKESSCQCRKYKRLRFNPWLDPLEKEMATHSSILAWKIPWSEEPGGLQSMGSLRVGHAWATNTHSNWWCWACFHVLMGQLHFSFGEMSIQILCPFLTVLSFYCWVVRVF